MLENLKSLKHQILLAMLYACGLRLSEIRNLKLSDVDFDRRTLHIRQGKSKKDRYVPLSELLIENLTQYIQSYTPKYWLFYGKKTRFYKSQTARYSPKGINWVVKHNAGAVGITKEISAHTFRHTYATHLLEDGLDIVSIKELLGHSKIETTMIYLHVAQYDKNPAFSPLDTLYGLRKKTQNFICPYAQHLYK